MSVVFVCLRSCITVSVVFFMSLAVVSGGQAEELRKTAQLAKPEMSSRPVTKGWEPVTEIKPVTQGWQTIAKSAVVQEKLNQLTDKDYDAALQAVHYALTEIEDGKIYQWRRNDSKLHGKVMPTSAFQDKEGRLCRHIVYTLTLDKYRKTVEGIACRSINGTWSLSG